MFTILCAVLFLSFVLMVFCTICRTVENETPKDAAMQLFCFVIIILIILSIQN